MVSASDPAALPDEIAAQITYLCSPAAIRERCGQLFDLACADQLRYFRCNLSQLDSVADYVLQVIQQSYPDRPIPFHSRWRHFEVGSDRLAYLNQQLDSASPLEQAQAKFDLAIVSVLLDAGAGADWHYTEAKTGEGKTGEGKIGEVYGRSEGLAIASFWMFCQGLFSSDPDRPLQVNASALQRLTQTQLAEGFQVGFTNPLVGLQGRTELLQRLGQTLEKQPHLFGTQSGNPTSRPGNLVNYLLNQAENGELQASQVFSAVLEGLGDIWAERLTLAGVNLGDVWVHPALATNPDNSLFSTLVPFHKLSQWLTYSLLEPLQDLGLTITNLDALTGLPEYRNGGLCVDLGLLEIKDPIVLEKAHAPGSEVIVEWRSLTVILLDQIAAALRQKLGLTAAALPLVKVLQGGTWTAGRQIAAELRPGGIPPIQIESDGTVF